MSGLELFFVAIGLSMDAFAVAICLGLSGGAQTRTHSYTVGAYFGFFQAAMPLLGFLVGSQFAKYITAIDHWIIFILLLAIGVNMIQESRHMECMVVEDLSFGKMLPLAIATSIDALAVGISFAFLQVPIFTAIGFIGIITFALSTFGTRIGQTFGSKFKSRAELCGGILLVAMGTKILLEHLRLWF